MKLQILFFFEGGGGYNYSRILAFPEKSWNLTHAKLAYCPVISVSRVLSYNNDLLIVTDFRPFEKL